MTEKENQLVGKQEMMKAKLRMFGESRRTLEERVAKFNETIRSTIVEAHKLGITQAEISNAIGVTKQWIWQVVHDYRKNGGAK